MPPDRSKIFLSSRKTSWIRITVVSALCTAWIMHPTASAQAKILDAFQDTVKTTTAPWMDNSLTLATELFSVMMAVSLVTAIVRYVSLNHTIEGFGHMFMDLFIKVIPLYVIMAGATTFLPNIVDFANALGGQITGQPINGPSEIFSIGTQMAGNVMKTSIIPFQYSGAPIIGEPAATLGYMTVTLGTVISLLLVFAFTLIAFEYFFAFAQAYITLSIGAISLGWLASPGTKHMAESYIAGAWISVMRLVVTIACVSLIVATVPNMSALASTGSPTTIVMSWIQLVGTTLFATLLAVKVPSLATNLFSGHPAVSAPEVAAAIMRTAARAVGR